MITLNNNLELNKLYFYKNNIDKSITEIIIDLIPQEVAYSYSANFHAQAALGRLSPLYIYKGGSDIELSFSVKLHEDFGNIRSTYKTLDNLVTQLKSLSYPSVNGGALENVVFYLGELGGEGIVNTSVSWEKPFRDGKYIVANISFNIIVLKQYPTTTFKEITEVVELPNGAHQTLTQTIYTTEEQKSLDYIVEEIGGYNTVYNNFIQQGDKAEAKEYFFSVHQQTFDYQAEIINNLYDTILSRDGDTKQVSNIGVLVKSLEEIKWAVNNENVTKKKQKSITKNLTALEAALKKYIKNDYKSNKDILASERDEAIAKISEIFESIEKSIEGMTKYGSNN